MTNSIIGEFYKKNLTRDEFGPICPRVKCQDDFSMSVQAGARLIESYSRMCEGKITHYEVGFPSEKEDLLMPYVEDAERPTDTVYCYVPVSVIDEVIRRHGGLKID